MNARATARATSAVLALLAAPAQATIVGTAHDLSTRAVSETQICLFCHTPHSARPASPLWNRRDPGLNYVPYRSSTAVARPGQPTGASLMCLSCHDGTIALGEVVSRATPIAMQAGFEFVPAGRGRLGTDLGDDHPVSFDYTSNLASQQGQLVPPSVLNGPVRLDANGQLQCTSCHDPHENSLGNFLVMPNLGGALCVTCHDQDFWSSPGTRHANSAATWNGIQPDPWPVSDFTNVRDNACQNCHQPHLAGGRERLLNALIEEDNCAPCHNGNVAAQDIMSVLGKTSPHPVGDTTGVHDPGEATVVNDRHVECVDCHNPHAAAAGGGTPPGPLVGVRGQSIDGADLAQVSFEFELCFRCHAGSSGKPLPRTPRWISQTDMRLAFSTANPTFHPVAGVGKNPDVPSLILPWSENSTMGCGDCHNNDAGPGAGGSGPNGPHGSIFEPILERRYVTLDNTNESSSTYALCYKCHSRNSILNDNSFGEHSKHIEGENSPCNVCHDPHGVDPAGVTSYPPANPALLGRLINFDTSVVSPVQINGQPVIRFESTGRFSGRCFLSCHGKRHDPLSY